MKTAKEIAFIGMYVALLIGSQFILSFISGIEIVTILFSAFCFKYGLKKGLILAIAFSLLRCFIFGFILDVVILYLTYYPLLCLVFSCLGKTLKEKYSFKNLIIVVLVAVIMTILFTMISNLITPLIYGYSQKAWQIYFTASLPVMLVQCVSVAITFIILFYPVQKLFNLIKN